MSKLTYDKNGYYLNGEPFQILSGAIHYFRVVPEYWEDRLLKLKECGFNTVETYVCWNLYERKEGQFDFSGNIDVSAFIKKAEELGLYVILRPGPYICAEWDMGGLPSWLQEVPGLRVRCYNKPFLEKVRNYYKVLFNVLRPHFIENGGNIIAMQLENEYGSFGDDQKYLQEIVKIYKENEIPCLCFTADGPGYFMLSGGSIPGYLAAVNFGSNPKGNFELLRKFRDDQPATCMEYWNGWFDHWYEEHHQRESGDAADVFEAIAGNGDSINMYMFHGGTNFGFYNGANYDNGIQPTVTSYDYNCPVSECGDLTEKYYAIHDRMEKILGKKLPLTVHNLPKKAYGELVMTEKADFFRNLDALAEPVEDAFPMTMEELGQDFGFVVYCSELEGPFEKLDMEIDGLHDRASIYFDEKFAGVKEETGKRNDQVSIGLGFGEKADLKIVVENMGRVNYGGHIFDKKGITRGVRIANRYHFGWKMYPVTCDDLSGLVYEDWKAAEDGAADWRPGFYKANFEVDEAMDTFVKLPGFCKGNVWINGMNIGRFYNPAGPQKTLYVPAPLLKKGTNEIIVLEVEKCENGKIEFVDKEEL